MQKKDVLQEDIEQPILDLKVVPKDGLPAKVPDVFGEAEYEDVVEHEQDIELVSLLNDIEVFLKIGDVDSAKHEYKKLLNIFNRLPVGRKKEYFDRVNKVYDEIKHPKLLQKEFRKSLST